MSGMNSVNDGSVIADQPACLEALAPAQSKISPSQDLCFL